MLKKTITYIDYNGVTRTEDFYFNFSKAEIAEMELSINGGLTEYINKIVQAQDSPTLVKLFKELVLKAYGVKSADGRRFEKSEEASKAFSETEAYSELFMELATNSEKAIEFFTEVIPKEASK